MEEIYLGGPPALYDPSPEPARLSIALTAGDTGVELVADPSDASVTLSMWGNESDDELSFDVEDFALVTTLLIRQAQRSL